ncbi:unnamed protein product [Scytosiphon promiscuus]
MTLGVVSFGLYLFQPVVPSGDLFLVFEFSHYVIFFIAIFTVLQLVMLGASTYPIRRRWDVAAYKSKEELLEGYRGMVAHLRKCSIPMFGVGRVSLDVFHWGCDWIWVDAVQYHLARSVFIRQHGRAANFDFARYASLVTDRQILSMANISFSSWLVLLVLQWISYGLSTGLAPDDETVSFKAWFTFGVVLCLLEILLLFACMLGVRRVCIKLGADPRDPVLTMDAVLDKIWVAPMTHLQHAASVHGAPRDGGATPVGSSVSDVPGKSGAVTSGPPPSAFPEVEGTSDVSAVARGVESSGGVEGGKGAAIRAGMEVESGGIPKITMGDAFVPSCKAYRRAVEILMLLNSYYLAFYAVYFISRASKSSTEWVWIIVLPLPILCGVLMAYRRVLPLIALLSTIVMMQPTDVADVEQEAEELNRLRRKLVIRLEDVLKEEFKACAKKGETYVCSEGHTSASFILNRWDEDANGNLSYEELEKGLEEIGLVLSNKQRRELLRLADPDRSGSVDVKELTELLYDVEIEIMAAVAGEEDKAGAPGVMAGGFFSGDGGAREGPNRSVSVGNVNERVERLLWRRSSERGL